ncbi:MULTISPECIES: N-acetylmuramoyl-L-alanine amidase [unclassified Endozoicomonas]|uniref:N-acetylmuramoyl-L-alanine amidase n=1 Tax=unclassified Endozoicomonas TaxID=2644528 RepID=UPI0021489333|nr:MULTISPECIES: N-acetylmuramoyl-L-alanine amidase [unclassified Endozoicomonas]
MALSFISHPSPNFDAREIPVEFLVLHYTAVDLQGTLDMISSPGCGVSAHLVIDLDGTVYELVSCLNGTAHRAWHAGISRWQEKEALNDFAIGIELVNYNGNVFPFTDAQYSALKDVIRLLQEHYPSLGDPQRIIGHEHIAGFRGKADPGCHFDWDRLFTESFPDQPRPVRESVCPKELQASLEKFQSLEPADREQRTLFWKRVNELTETSVRLIQEGVRSHS